MILRRFTKRQLFVLLLSLTALPGSYLFYSHFQRQQAARMPVAVTRDNLPATIESSLLEQMNFYNHLQALASPEGVLLSADKAPAGLYLIYRLDPSRRYSLTLSGRRASGESTLRMQGDDGEFRYSAAPHGESMQIVNGVSRLELLFYADSPFQYEIMGISLQECPTCRTDEDLKEEIRAEVPNIDALLARNPLEAAEAILRWAAPQIDFAIDKEIVEVGTDRVMRGTAADSFYRLFEKNESGVYCGGAAVFLDKIYRLFGLQSTTIDFGVSGTNLTHVTVILTVRDKGGRWRFYIFDPTFDATFKMRQGRFARVGELLSDSAQRSLPIVFDRQSLAKRTWLISKTAMKVDPGMASRCEEIVESRSSDYVCLSPSYDLAFYARYFDSEFREQNIHPDDRLLVELLRKGVFSIGGFPDPNATREFQNLLRSFDVPLH